MKVRKQKKGQKRAHKPKIVIRMRMKNLSYIAHNPDKVVQKNQEFNGDWFPPHIVAINDPFEREDAMKMYMELHHGLKLQKKYKHSCQSEMTILKLSRRLGLFPTIDPAHKREFKRWDAKMKFLARKKAERKAKFQLARRKPVTHKPYTFLLLQQAKAGGFKPAVRIRKPIRKEARVKVSIGHKPEVLTHHDHWYAKA
jgi:hypothetical protein